MLDPKWDVVTENESSEPTQRTSLYVATIGNSVVGVIGTRLCGMGSERKRAELIPMSIASEWQNLDVERRLLEHAVEAVRGDSSNIFFFSSPATEKYDALYRAHGFRVHMGNGILSNCGPVKTEFCKPLHQKGVTIRPYERKDKQIAMRLFIDGIMEVFDPATRPHLYKENLEWAQTTSQGYDDVASMMNAANGGRIFVAANGEDEVIGTVGVLVSDEDKAKNRVELKRMSVDPRYRSCGVGRALLERVMEYSRRDLQAKTMWLESLEDYRPAVAMYKKYGFKLTRQYRHEGDEPNTKTDEFVNVVFYARWL